MDSLIPSVSPVSNPETSQHKLLALKSALHHRKYALVIGMVFVMCLVGVTGFILGYHHFF